MSGRAVQRLAWPVYSPAGPESHRRLNTWCILGLTLSLLALLMPATALAAPSGNVLANGDFEQDARRTSLSSWVAQGWNPWFFQEPGNPYSREPEFGQLNGRQRHGGERAERWFNNYGIHDAGLWQQANVPAGSYLVFSIWAISWSSARDVWAVSDSHYNKWVGIDPTGGTDPSSPNIVWSEANRDMDQWIQLSVSTVARSETVTVFVRGKPDWAVKHNNNVIVDDAVLTYDTTGGPPPPATSTPAPGSEPVSSPPAQPTQPADAPGVAGRKRAFDVTGHTVSGEWLAWFNRNGGIDNNGLPRSEVIVDPITGQWVQYFQRVVLEWHPENPPAHRIQRRLLGDALYPGADPALDPATATVPVGSSAYIFFPLSSDRPTGLGHGVTDIAPDGTNIGFRTYFSTRGGVNAFGYPKEEPVLRNGRWTQRFQAAVFEYHPENDKPGFIPGTRTPYRQYRVQLELLGDNYIALHNLGLQ